MVMFRRVQIETRTPEELLETELDFVVHTLQTFDPMGVRNSIAVAAALREAERRGFKTAVTGDGADEMLGG
jgi:asparagine synthetase B (glutamine-hydrolysing)